MPATATLTYTTDLDELTISRGRAPGLGLTAHELEELLTAVGDREDQAGTDARARLQRGRRALERELAVLLSE